MMKCFARFLVEMNPALGWLGPLVLAVLCLSCRDPLSGPASPVEPEAADTANLPEEAHQVFQVKGTVAEVLAKRNKVRIAHEEIPDYMMAMTMLFDVKEAGDLEGLAAGDQVEFRMIVTKDDGWIDQIRKVGQVDQVSTELPSTFRLVREVEPLKVGDPMPNYFFTNATGQAMSLHDYRGQPYAITFIFTRCPFPTFCPRMSTRMQEVYETLRDHPQAPPDWHLFSITIDPAFDTPEVLRNYAGTYTYDPKRWSYLTGKLIDITAITEQFGLQFYWPDPDQPAGLTHNLRTVVVGADGKVRKILTGNEWLAEELSQAMLE